MVKPEAVLAVAAGKRRLFYGYVVVAAGFLASIFILGNYISFGVFFKPLIQEFGWTRVATAAGTSIASIVMGICAIGAGRLTDRYGPRVVLLASGLFMGVGTLLMARINTLWQLYLFYGLLVGISMSAAEVPIIATVARWFVKRRGMMTGITKVGAGVAIMVVPLGASWLISNYGWRMAYTVIGTVVLVGVTLVALLFKRDPGQISEFPDGVAEVDTAGPDVKSRQFSAREALATRQFWTFSAAWFSYMFCQQVILTHIVPHITDIGISATIAASIISVIGAFSILGRLGLTGLSDTLGIKRTYLINFSLLTAGMLWLQFAKEPWMFYLFAALYGTAHGGNFSLLSPMLARLFGLEALGVIIGMVLFIGTFGSLSSPMLAGWLFDIMGNYQLAFLTLLVFSVAGLVLISLLRPIGTRGEGTNDQRRGA